MRSFTLPLLLGIAAGTFGVDWVSGAHPAWATTRSVPGGYATIQAAIDASVNGDVVEIAPGSYTGPGNIGLSFNGKAITCRSSAGAEVTEIVGHGFDFWNGETRAAVVQGLTIRDTPTGSWSKGAISIHSASPTIQGCVLRENFALHGGGGISISGAGSNPRIVGCRILSNHAWERGGGILADDNTNMLVEDCVIAGNWAEPAWFEGSSYGGAVYAYSGTFRRCLIFGNTATVAAGFYFTGGGTFEHCTLAGDAGREIYSISTLHITDSIIWNDCWGGTYLWSEGGGVYVTCSMLDPARVHGTMFYSGAPIEGDPQFCQPSACQFPTEEGEYSLQDSSPGRPANNACGVFLGAVTTPACFASSVLEPPTSAAPRLGIPFPNPSRGGVSLAATLDEPGPVRIVWQDASGREVGPAQTQWMPRGQSELALRGTTADGRPLPAGVYLVTLRTNAGVAARRVVLLPR